MKNETKNENPTGIDITVIVDRSGSMQSIQRYAIESFNTFLDSKKRSHPDALMSIILFNHEYQKYVSLKPIGEVENFDSVKYVPGGNTALLDAIGRTIYDIDERQHENNSVLVVILTDGQENASTEFTHTMIREQIQRHEETGWDFYYLSADLNVYRDARMMGFDPAKTAYYDKMKMSDAYLEFDKAIDEKDGKIAVMRRRAIIEDKMFR